VIALFFKDCGYEVTVHDNQCIWFEQVCGLYQFKQGNYRQALKEYTHAIGHITNMIEDQYDYYLYSLRKFTLTAFEGLLVHNNNELHKYKHVVKVVIGLCKLALKLNTIKDEELAKLVPEFETYRNSEEFAKLQKDIKAGTDDDEEYKKDTDPKGFQKY